MYYIIDTRNRRIRGFKSLKDAIRAAREYGAYTRIWDDITKSFVSF